VGVAGVGEAGGAVGVGEAGGVVGVGEAGGVVGVGEAGGVVCVGEAGGMGGMVTVLTSDQSDFTVVWMAHLARALIS